MRRLSSTYNNVLIGSEPIRGLPKDQRVFAEWPRHGQLRDWRLGRWVGRPVAGAPPLSSSASRVWMGHSAKSADHGVPVVLLRNRGVTRGKKPSKEKVECEATGGHPPQPCTPQSGWLVEPMLSAAFEFHSPALAGYQSLAQALGPSRCVQRFRACSCIMVPGLMLSR
ncbi:hypothetical protein VTO42DRAFT_5108 [Malbranchea cinnamomea]